MLVERGLQPKMASVSVVLPSSASTVVDIIETLLRNTPSHSLVTACPSRSASREEINDLDAPADIEIDIFARHSSSPESAHDVRPG